jgi:hypothetical protein
MKEVRNIEWFRDALAPKLEGYELSYRFFDDGDFGFLNQVEFNSKKIGGNIDFWGLGWLGIFVWSYEAEQELLNFLLDPGRGKEQEEALKRLQELL